MNLQTPAKLNTKRLTLRRMVANDYKPFYEFMRNPQATKYMLFSEEQKTKESVKQLLDLVIQGYDTKNEIFALTIEEKESGQYIGTLGTAPLENGEGVEIFYTLLPRYWNKGFAIEACHSLLGYLLNELNIPQVNAFCNEENIASQKIAEKLGMTNSGSVVKEDHVGRMYLIKNKRM